MIVYYDRGKWNLDLESKAFEMYWKNFTLKDTLRTLLKSVILKFRKQVLF